MDRGERGRRSDHFSRGRQERDRGDYRDREYDDNDRRYTSREYDEYDGEVRYRPPLEHRNRHSSEYEVFPEPLDRERDDRRDYGNDDEREPFFDSDRRSGFLRGENVRRYGRDDQRIFHEARRPGDFGQAGRWSGPYAGRGPKGYRRSDERIQEEVCERLTEHPSIDASDIEVLVADGDVTLAGLVESRAIKHLTEAMTETVAGVKEVHNQLRIAARAADTGQFRSSATPRS